MRAKQVRATSTPPARPISNGHVSRTARWPGNPLTRPPTDAELELRDARYRRLARLLLLLITLALLVFLYAPEWLMDTLLEAPKPVRPLVMRTLSLLVSVYPWFQRGALLLLVALLLHLCIAACLVGVQRRNRAARVFRTLALEIAPTPALSPMQGVDLFVGLQRLNRVRERWRGREETLVFALVSGTDGRMRMRVRGPADDRDWTTFLCQQIEGRAPGTTARPTEDDLAIARADAAPGQMLGWCDLVLMRDASYPLNDLGQFAADPLGPLAATLRTSSQVHYAAYELILRAVENRWRRRLRTQVAQIEARLTPDDLTSHEALLRKADQVAYDVVVRCIVIADEPESARAKLHDMHDALAQLDRTTRGITQRLHIPAVDRFLPAGAQGRVVRIRPTAARHPAFILRDLSRLLGLVLLGSLLGLVLGEGVLPHLRLEWTAALEYPPRVLSSSAALFRPICLPSIPHTVVFSALGVSAACSWR